MRRHHRPRGSHLGLLLLASQLFRVGVDNIPPVTLGVLGLNVYLYLFPPPHSCSVQKAYWHGDWRRLFLSPLHHMDDWHLYFNLTSFLWKGIQLERRLGGAWFLYVLSVFSLLTGLVWVELVLIHLTNPGTSLIGHLAGILVGLLYTAGPLKSIMKTCAGGQQDYTGGLTEQEQYDRAMRNSMNDIGGSRQAEPSAPPAPPPYGFHLSDEEVRRRRLMRQAEPSAPPAPPPYGSHLSDEEVRRRLMRFDR
ncbi:hypothetical protein CRUP_030048 [Coryphaenoides rupestris]|nr:hypothetical protein CRUP_030048 [Coryphaenoides rupestris]